MIWPANDDGIIEQVVLNNEGGFVNDPADHGGATNFGITIGELAASRGHSVTVDDVRNMQRSEAISIYRTRYIVQPKFDQIVSLRIRTILVDSGVLFGPSVTTLGLQTIAGVPIDGEIGAKTLAVLSQLDPRTVTNSLAIWRIKRHANRCSVDPSQVIFLKGWINRACSFIE